MKGIAVLRTAILRETCDETLTDELSGLPGGLAAQTLPLILAYFDNQFGVLASTDLRALAAKANNMRFTFTSAFRAEAAKLGLIYAQLDRQDQKFPDLYKTDVLRKATSMIAPIVTAIQDYDRECLRATPRTIGTFTGMVAYIRDHAGVTAGDLVYAAATAAPPLVYAAVRRRRNRHCSRRHPQRPAATPLPAALLRWWTYWRTRRTSRTWRRAQRVRKWRT
jgi:hypothetical protein